jgi:hypothetical protein
MRKTKRDEVKRDLRVHTIEDPCSPAESGTGNLPNVRKLIIVIRSLTPQPVESLKVVRQATGNALAVHFQDSIVFLRRCSKWKQTLF